ncbi:hypothetical protein [uncultured Modestobacter sp.]|uniref:hypothetical protein n=1 Tax=uncultured Modestobacter sp. TaxID=380048 RepID=UPI0026202884|nr:hypothetical protein [uncultured Modestobacter sp.]
MRAGAVAGVVLLVFGSVVHVVHLMAAGTAVYEGQPGWLRLYFVSLTVFDPVAAVLLARARRSGVVLAVAVLVTDAAANGWANHVVDTSAGITVGRVGQAVITGLAVAALAWAPAAWRHARRAR